MVVADEVVCSDAVCYHGCYCVVKLGGIVSQLSVTLRRCTYNDDALCAG